MKLHTGALALSETLGRVAPPSGRIGPAAIERILRRSERIWRARRPRKPKPARNPFGLALSKREREVLGLLVRGLSNSEISGELGISRRTVKFHVVNMLRKSGKRDRVNLVIWWFAGQERAAAPAGLIHTRD